MIAQLLYLNGMGMHYVVPRVVCHRTQLIYRHFFENSERVFGEIRAPDRFWAQLLLPYLSDKARSLVSKMDQMRACVNFTRV